MNMETICLLAVLCISLLWLFTISVIGILINKQIQANRILEEKKLIYSLNIDDSNFEFLDKLINDSILTYQILNHGFEDNLYINEKEQSKMVESILSDVLNKLSPIYYEKLILLYNSIKLEDIIFEKVSLAVMGYVQQTNSTLQKI